MKQITLLLAALFLMNGCSDETKEDLKKEISFKTVAYYQEHKELMELRLKECRLMTKMTPSVRQDCDNAKKAARKAVSGKLPEWN